MRVLTSTAHLALCLAVVAEPSAAQAPAFKHAGSDSTKVAAGPHYQAGKFKRFVLGDAWRDLWATPITVPVLDLRRFAGGLKPTETGGGKQTRSLRFLSADGTDYVFRLVDKASVELPDGFEGTVLESLALDQVSTHHPGAAVVAAPLIEAAAVLHVTPILAVMPDDPLLGEFQEEFAGKLGMIEVYPTKPDDAPGFADAVEIVESQELRERFDQDPDVRIDARAYLAARLMDMLLNDWDRHPGNWKWARLTAEPVWKPIPRDRDRAFSARDGIFSLAPPFFPNLITFKSTYPSLRGLTWNSLEFDRRLLGGLERPAWDSVAKALQRRITDAVIDSAVGRMPREYQGTGPALAAALRQRRDLLPELAGRFYTYLAAGPDIHATDADDRARIIRHEDGSVEVLLHSAGDDAPWFRRRFHPDETDEVRVYLHGGDDRAVVTGEVERSMPVRIIGGNGTNVLIDSSRVPGRPLQARFYDHGSVNDVEYSEPDTLFDRRPWVRMQGELVAPGRDRGRSMGPVVAVNAPGDLGIIFQGGLRQSRYGFRVRPYAGRAQLTAEYATGVDDWRVTGSIDRRREGNRIHFLALARMSEFEVIRFHGLGNDTPEELGDTFRVEQRQWLLQPAVAFALDDRSDITFGPVLQYSTSDSLAGTINTSYGFGDFGQAGLRLGLHYDRRDQADNPGGGFLVDVSADWYPGIWDVVSSFGALGGTVTTYHTLPLPLDPILVLRGSGRTLAGDFPFHESAFIGGRGSVRVLDLQRYAGDAGLAGTTELRLPLGRVPVILPFDLGIYGFADAGRVWFEGDSPDGWHAGAGGGFWVGLLNPSLSLNVELGRYRGESRVRVRTGLGF